MKNFTKLRRLTKAQHRKKLIQQFWQSVFPKEYWDLFPKNGSCINFAKYTSSVSFQSQTRAIVKKLKDRCILAQRKLDTELVVPSLPEIHKTITSAWLGYHVYDQSCIQLFLNLARFPANIATNSILLWTFYTNISFWNTRFLFGI